MDAASSAIRLTILEMVGAGHTVPEIRERLGREAKETDFQYAESLVRVRDQVRHEQLSRRAAAA